MRLAFRADASSQIGTGHVMRCLTLADGMRSAGAECLFVCRAHEGHLMKHIRSRGYEVLNLATSTSADSSTSTSLAHASWLGVDWQTDAEQTRRMLGSQPFDWLIVDHYALDHRWETFMRSSCNHIMAIDDLADRQHNCDILLDQNHGSSEDRYRGLAPLNCMQLHGPEYALLKPEYAEQRTRKVAGDGRVLRVLIYFGGGADERNLTGITVRAFQAPQLAHIELDIVVGAAYAYQSSLEEIAAKRGNAAIHCQLPDLAHLMAKADLSIGAGGATSWERCCMGLPSIVISIAENQRPSCHALSNDKLIDYLSDLNQVTPELIRDRVLSLLKRPEFLREMSDRGMRLVDGKGIKKITKFLLLKAHK